MATKSTETPEVKVKVRNWLNWNEAEDGTKEKPNTLPSMTVPDMSLSVEEIVNRMQMGLPPEGERIPVFDEGSEFPDISRMDLTDRMNFIKYYQRELEALLTPKEATQKAMEILKDEKADKLAAERAIEDTLIVEGHTKKD